ncbi:MAG: SMI1/KNR4 family protein [Albidovulum sp.]|uniref:SMI1/KNR4 family protein n=1 Tax=Albidovulum sp. TaxID=1872424 RepID=UPI003CC46263
MTHPLPVHDELIENIKGRVPGYEMHLNGPPPPPAAPFLAANSEAVEHRLGFRLPDLLVQLYVEVGNGGFGPGYGLMGLGEGGFTDDLSQTADDLYRFWRSEEAKRDRCFWPKGVLPVSPLGCAMYACIGTKLDEVLIWEPNLWNKRNSVKSAIFRTSMTLADWLGGWADGKTVSCSQVYGHNSFADLPPLARPLASPSAVRRAPKDQTDFLDKL